MLTTLARNTLGTHLGTAVPQPTTFTRLIHRGTTRNGSTAFPLKNEPPFAKRSLASPTRFPSSSARQVAHVRRAAAPLECVHDGRVSPLGHGDEVASPGELRASHEDRDRVAELLREASR
jgi:hypothetical protein